MRVTDWEEIRTKEWHFTWRHDKKGESHPGWMPDALARALNDYVDATAAVRAALGTDLVFLAATRGWRWCAAEPDHVEDMLARFVRTHGLKRGGKDLPLTPAVTRRTFSTDAIRNGLSLPLLSLMLGHARFATTRIYVKIDRAHHPKAVRKSLDAYARRTLPLWNAPGKLSAMPAKERDALLRGRVRLDQEVGLCAAGACVMTADGVPIPCTLCRHLATDSEYMPAWRAQITTREERAAAWDEQGLSLPAANERSIAQQEKTHFERLFGEPA